MVIARGAEAVLKESKDGLEKARVPKGYRHPQLDEKLRKERTRAELKILKKAREHGVSVPEVTGVDDSTLLLSKVNGSLVKDSLDDDPKIATKVGEEVAKLHDLDLIHGDLTTSNMLWRDGEVMLIDFGLAFQSRRIEDKAVDVHVFEQVLRGRHHQVADRAFAAFKNGYAACDAAAVFERLDAVRKRGKNK